MINYTEITNKLKSARFFNSVVSFGNSDVEYTCNISYTKETLGYNRIVTYELNKYLTIEEIKDTELYEVLGRECIINILKDLN